MRGTDRRVCVLDTRGGGTSRGAPLLRHTKIPRVMRSSLEEVAS